MQQKTQRPVQFEMTPPAREAVQAWIKQAQLRSEDFLFPSRIHDSPHLGTRQYARILESWEGSGVGPTDQEPQSSAVATGHSKFESTVRYLVSRSTMPSRLPNKQRSEGLEVC